MDADPRPRNPRTVKVILAAALTLGVALVGVGAGGMVGVDRKLEAATPTQGKARVVREGHAKRGDCPAGADKPRAKESRKL